MHTLSRSAGPWLMAGVLERLFVPDKKKCLQTGGVYSSICVSAQARTDVLPYIYILIPICGHLLPGTSIIGGGGGRFSGAYSLLMLIKPTLWPGGRFSVFFADVSSD